MFASLHLATDFYILSVGSECLPTREDKEKREREKRFQAIDEKEDSVNDSLIQSHALSSSQGGVH